MPKFFPPTTESLFQCAPILTSTDGRDFRTQAGIQELEFSETISAISQSFATREKWRRIHVIAKIFQECAADKRERASATRARKNTQVKFSLIARDAFLQQAASCRADSITRRASLDKARLPFLSFGAYTFFASTCESAVEGAALRRRRRRRRGGDSSRRRAADKAHFCTRISVINSLVERGPLTCRLSHR